MSKKSTNGESETPRRLSLAEVQELAADETNRNSKTYQGRISLLAREIEQLHQDGGRLRKLLASDGHRDEVTEAALDIHCGLDLYVPHAKRAKARDFLRQAQAAGVDLSLVQEMAKGPQ